MFKLWDQEILSGFWVLIHILLLKQWVPKLFTKYLRLRVRTFSFRFVWNNIYIFSPSAGPVAFTFNVSVTLSLCYLYHHFFFSFQFCSYLGLLPICFASTLISFILYSAYTWYSAFYLTRHVFTSHFYHVLVEHWFFLLIFYIIAVKSWHYG